MDQRPRENLRTKTLVEFHQLLGVMSRSICTLLRLGQRQNQNAAGRSASQKIEEPAYRLLRAPFNFRQQRSRDDPPDAAAVDRKYTYVFLFCTDMVHGCRRKY